jgi:hypothetical protein
MDSLVLGIPYTASYTVHQDLPCVYLYNGAGIVQWYRAGIRARLSGVRVPAEAGNFFLHHRVQTGSGIRPTSYAMDTRGSFRGVERPGREADRSPPSHAAVKNAWNYTSTPPIHLRGVVLS